MVQENLEGSRSRCAPKPVYNICTGDESCINSYDSETKQQSTYGFYDEQNLTKVVHGRSTSKQMVARFLCSTCHVVTLPLEQCGTIKLEWYTTI